MSVYVINDIGTVEEFDNVLPNIVKDKSGKDVAVNCHFGKADLCVALTIPQRVPIGCIALCKNNRAFGYEDNEFRDINLLDHILRVSNTLQFNKVLNDKDRLISVIRYFGEFACVTRAEDHKILSCVAIGNDGLLSCYWTDAEFRGNKSPIFNGTGITMGLKNEWIGKGLKKLYTHTSADNFASNRHQINAGFSLSDTVEKDGVKFNVYSQDVSKRLEQLKELCVI